MLRIRRILKNERLIWKRIGIASMFAVTVVGIGAAALGGNFNVKLPKKS